LGIDLIPTATSLPVLMPRATIGFGHLAKGMSGLRSRAWDRKQTETAASDPGAPQERSNWPAG